MDCVHIIFFVPIDITYIWIETEENNSKWKKILQMFSK